MPVRVLFFASAREVAGCGQRELPGAEEGWSEEEFWEHLLREIPALETLRPSVRLARNEEYLATGERILPGDEVAVLPPVSGG